MFFVVSITFFKFIDLFLKEFRRFLISPKIKREWVTTESKLSQKSPKHFECNLCDYVCSKSNDLMKHESTRKHKRKLAGDVKIATKEFQCEICQKNYKSRNGLWKHSKNCAIEDFINTNNDKELMMTILNDNSDFKNIVLDIVKQNLELNKQNLELNKQNHELNKQVLNVYQKNPPATITNNGSHNNHSNNKTFNMQIFLNEQCKDAMNIMDFVDTFKLEFSDLEKVGEVGYVEGISGIIIKKLNEMDIYKRPIHCSDAKRETTFVKYKNVWEKENGNRDKLRLAIKHITKKNTDMLNRWSAAHPGSCDSDNYLNDVYMEIVRQAMGAGHIEENENKIMRKIARSVLIDKYDV